MERIENFFKNLRDDGLSNNEIAAGLGNGDIDAPEWMSISENTDHIKAWDADNGGSIQMGFVTISYDGKGNEHGNKNNGHGNKVA